MSNAPQPLPLPDEEPPGLKHRFVGIWLGVATVTAASGLVLGIAARVRDKGESAAPAGTTSQEPATGPAVGGSGEPGGNPWPRDFRVAARNYFREARLGARLLSSRPKTGEVGAMAEKIHEFWTNTPDIPPEIGDERAIEEGLRDIRDGFYAAAVKAEAAWVWLELSRKPATPDPEVCKARADAIYEKDLPSIATRVTNLVDLLEKKINRR